MPLRRFLEAAGAGDAERAGAELEEAVAPVLREAAADTPALRAALRLMERELRAAVEALEAAEVEIGRAHV